MNDQEKIAAYIKKHDQWSSQLNSIRKVLQSTELSETVKWGAPSYTINNKIVATFAGFKNHCAVWFQQGVFLKDDSKKLVNAQEGTTKGLRQWRFQAGDKVEARLLNAYVKEAIENQKTGKQIKPEKKELVIPTELGNALKKNTKLKTGFDSLTPGKQREFADHIGAAKQEKTRLSRLEKATPLITKGIGIFDHYKNC